MCKTTIRKLGELWRKDVSVKSAAKKARVSVWSAAHYFNAFDNHDEGCPSAAIEGVIDCSCCQEAPTRLRR